MSLAHAFFHFGLFNFLSFIIVASSHENPPGWINLFLIFGFVFVVLSFIAPGCNKDREK